MHSPIFLLADSQLLFWKDDGPLFLQRVREHLANESPCAAYIGASNADAPEFYALFEAAMDGIGVTRRRMIRSDFSDEDRAFLESADVIVLSGGDVEAGWRVVEHSGMKQAIEQRFEAGAVLMGVSAGAMQLGRYGIVEIEDASHRLIDTFGWVPFVIGAHDERRDWSGLISVVGMLEGAATGIGLSSGAGMIYHPDGSLEAIRKPADLFACSGSGVTRSLILPCEAQPDA